MVPSIAERMYRLCTWHVDRDDGTYEFNHCIHLDGEFNVCTLHKRQFEQRERADKRFTMKRIYEDIEYPLEEWHEILNNFHNRVGKMCPCDQNISGKEVAELVNSGVI